MFRQAKFLKNVLYFVQISKVLKYDFKTLPTCMPTYDLLLCDMDIFFVCLGSLKSWPYLHSVVNWRLGAYT